LFPIDFEFTLICGLFTGVVAWWEGCGSKHTSFDGAARTKKSIASGWWVLLKMYVSEHLQFYHV
jgi:hypothetical protein